MRFAIAFVVLAACSRGGGDGAPACPSIGARFFQIARDELAASSVDDATRRGVADQLPAMRDALAQSCADSAWPADIRSCLADAADRVAFTACESRLDPAALRALDLAARGQIDEQ
jgi:hypothetical protein|nr:hypothetical protein [Kofleriaceae bacterium]